MSVRPRRKRLLLVTLALALIALFAAVVSRNKSQGTPAAKPTLKVLAYSSFVSSWGPGPEIVRLYKARHGVEVELRDAEDAGLLLKKLELFPSDVVIGFDQLLLPSARKSVQWRTLPTRPGRYQEIDFAAFDWGPLAVIYREGEIKPPTSLNDLLDARFKGKLSLQDPRTSSPGLQFLFWVLETKGVDGGFEYLAKLKPSIHTVSPSWSTAYGLFQNKQASLALSYLTSPVYHWVNDKDESYRAAVFSDGHPVQIEYAGIPDNCVNCDEAISFVQFLLEPEIQKLIMEKNLMFPVIEGIDNDTPFQRLPSFTPLEIRSQNDLLNRRDELFIRWRELGL